MEVDQAHFRKQLLPILGHISRASFVAFDLEMSGIQKNRHYGGGGQSQDAGKPSLQKVYEETRLAAETYQVLQVGITCVEEDREKGYYLARPYNFNLSPLFYLDNKIKERFPERNIVFSSSTADFLQREGFNIGKVFAEGVFYLSHAEEEQTRTNFEERDKRQANKSDAVIPPSDTGALDFYRNARKTISAWVNDTKPEHNFVNIGDPDGALNGYQRLLVHQLVKNEFPGYRSFARNNQSFIQIVKINPKKEADDQAKKLNEFNSAVVRQIGLRWIFEALSGGDLEDIPITWFCDESESKPELHPEIVEREFTKIKEVLKTKDHIIVGHNLFTDLVFLYNTFIGTLPLKVEDFKEKVRGLFPTVIDTKFLATHGCDSISPLIRQGLGELLEPFKIIHSPLIVLDENHTAYGAGVGKTHEAGFDSWMTAELFVKLSAKLHAERKQTLEVFSSDNDSDPDSLLENITSSSCEDEPGGARLDSSSNAGELQELFDTNGASHSTSVSQPPAWHQERMQNFYLHSNPYSLLDDLGEALPSLPEPTQWTPSKGSSFWDIYANKLRVNASEEGVCDLNELID